jgi:hypothetical protein
MATAAKKQAPPPTKGKEVAAAKSTALATQEEVPDYIKQGGGRGNEHVSTEDVVIPRIEQVQALSPCLDKNDSAYIEDAEVGGFFNSVSREFYGERVSVVPVFFQKQFLVWKDRQKGGGFRGAHNTAEEARARIEEEPSNEQDDFDVIDTAQQLVLVVREDGSSEEAVLSMARTKMKVSKQWNSMIRMAGGDRFSRKYDLVGVADENDKGKFYNIGIVPAGYPSKEIYQKAEALYVSVNSGARKVVVDSDEGEAGGTDRGSGEY